MPAQHKIKQVSLTKPDNFCLSSRRMVECCAAQEAGAPHPRVINRKNNNGQNQTIFAVEMLASVTTLHSKF